MVNVTNRPDVHMRLVALEFLLRHVPLTSRRMAPTGSGSTAPIVNRRLQFKIWSGGRDLNPQPSPWKSETLPLSYPRPSLRKSVLQNSTVTEPHATPSGNSG